MYDDGGISGATLERPALQRLLGDIEARKVDTIVVYMSPSSSIRRPQWAG
jgi:DNA invertase Pin-like site-specific DNA recombinase